MSKLLASVAAIGALSLVAFTPAVANEPRADGAKNNGQVEQWEFSDQRRYYRRHYSRRYWAPRRYGYYRPYYGYRRPYYGYRRAYYGYRPYYRPSYYAPYYGYRPYYRPGLSIGFAFGPRWGW